MAIERRRGSTLSKLDDALLVVAAIVAVLVVLAVVSWFVHALMFFLKVAIAAVIFGVIFKAVSGRRN